MDEGGDVRDHLNDFFDTVDKLGDMNIIINPDQLTIMLLYSLPSSFENFRCAIESRDDLPTADNLRTKIIEENDVRKTSARSEPSNAMSVKQGDNCKDRKQYSKPVSKDGYQNKKKFELRCYLCNKSGHKKSDCWYNKNKKQSAKLDDDLCLNNVEISVFQLDV